MSKPPIPPGQNGGGKPIIPPGKNVAPVAVADFTSVQEDSVLTAYGNVLTNDTDGNAGDTKTVTTAGTFTGAYGSLLVHADGSYTYTLNNSNAAVQSLAHGQHLTDEFAYTMRDAAGATSSSTLTIAINGPNDGPILHSTLDIVVPNSLSNNIGVLAGDGAGGFAPVITFSSGGSYPHHVALGDVNDDGNLDLVVPNYFSNAIGVLKGDGAGHFTPAVTFGSGGSGPSFTALGDVNGDGNLDIVTNNYDSSTIGLLVGDGAGGFAPAIIFQPGGISPAAVTLGDVNGDGKLDMVIPNSDNVGVLIGNGSGGFATAVTFVTGGGAVNSVQLGDVTGDGKVDLVAAISNNVAVLAGNGIGGFAAPVTFSTGGSGNYALALGDVNGDGKLDIVNGHAGSANVSVLIGDGAGGFAAAVLFDTGPGRYPGSLALGDVNGDGKLDIAVVSDSTSVGVLMGDGAGSFGPPVLFFNGGIVPGRVVLGDVITGVLPDQSIHANDAFGLAVPVNAFTDPDGDTLTLSAMLSSGQSLPAWLHFDAVTRLFSGTPAVSDVGSVDIAVRATDPGGLFATDMFTLNVLV